MDLSLTETQQLLKQSIEDFLARDATREAIVELQETERGYSPDHWRTIAETGWLGVLIPPEYGGAGGSLMDAAVVYEALGRGPVPGPMFSSGVLCSQVILQLASEAQKRDLLPRIASGEIVCALALSEPAASWGARGVRLRPRADGDHYVLDGVKLFVFDAHVADYLLTAVRTGEAERDVTLLLVDAHAPGVTTRRLAGFTSSESEVEFRGVRVSTSAVLGTVDGAMDGLDRALRDATPVLCAYATGGGEAVFDMSVEYSRSREQFGQPIGRFQFVQNHIVQLINHVDAGRWTTYEAIWKLETGRPDAEIAVHLAKAVTSEGYRRACDFAHEVHAGVGVMREYGLTLFTRLSRSLYHALGDPRYHRKQIANLVGSLPTEDE